MYLASQDLTKGATTPEIARQTHIPEPFLNQILLALKNAGVLRSRRGAGGGYVFNREPSTITLGEVARLMDGPLAPIPCASVTAYEPCPTCPEPQSCNLRLLMRQVRDSIAAILDKTTLEELTKGSFKLSFSESTYS
jgi:Rrf2 family protein